MESKDRQIEKRSGLTRRNHSIGNEEVSKDIEHSMLRTAARSNHEVCYLCKEVAYCGSVHQKEHWRIHKKKTCTVRKKEMAMH